MCVAGRAFRVHVAFMTSKIFASVVTGHVLTDDFDVGVFRARLVDYLAFAHDQDAIGEREDLFEIRADEEDGGARVASFEDARADLRDGPEIETEAGVRRDEQ